MVKQSNSFLIGEMHADIKGVIKRLDVLNGVGKESNERSIKNSTKIGALWKIFRILWLVVLFILGVIKWG